MLFFAQALTSLSNGPSYVALFLRQVAALHFATKKAPLRLAIYRGVIFNFEHMTKESDIHLGGLNGYLNCLSRLCGPGYSFNVNMFEVESDVDAFIATKIEEWKIGDEYCSGTEYNYSGKYKIEFNEICDRLAGYIFNGLLKNSIPPDSTVYEQFKRVFIEDINEYYGLISTTLNYDGVFHPLIRGPVFEIALTSVKHENIFCFLVKIESFYVLSIFSKRNSAV